MTITPSPGALSKLTAWSAMPEADRALEQLRWWLRLTITNLIERADWIRFHHACSLIIHQLMVVLFALNRIRFPRSYPSPVGDALDLLDKWPTKPPTFRQRLQKAVSAADPATTWANLQAILDEVVWLATGSRETAWERPRKQQERDLNRTRVRAWACEVASAYAALPGIKTVVLTDSLASGYADEQSDVDLVCYGELEPEATLRHQRAMAYAHGQQGIIIEPACDTVVTQGPLLHIRYRLLREVEDWLAHWPVLPDDPFLAEQVQRAKPLYDPQGLLRQWQALLTPLPPVLVKRLIFNRAELFPRFRAMLDSTAREADWVSHYCLRGQAVHDFLIALFALNGLFLSTPRWCHRYLPTFSLKPPSCYQRLIQVLHTPALTGEGLHHLWQDLLALCPHH